MPSHPGRPTPDLLEAAPTLARLPAWIEQLSPAEFDRGWLALITGHLVHDRLDAGDRAALVRALSVVRRRYRAALGGGVEAAARPSTSAR